MVKAREAMVAKPEERKLSEENTKPGRHAQPLTRKCRKKIDKSLTI